MSNKCDTCQFKKHYTTGTYEYPELTTIAYCSKEHWADGDMFDDVVNPNPWESCKDFAPTPPETP
jgi:hypothetical protein